MFPLLPRLYWPPEFIIKLERHILSNVPHLVCLQYSQKVSRTENEVTVELYIISLIYCHPVNALCLMDIKPCVSFTKLGTVVLYLGVFFIGKNKKLKISWLKWWNIIRSSDFSYFFLFCRAQVKVQVQVRSRSGRSELDLTLTIFLVFTTTHPPQTWVGWTQVGSEVVRTSRWTPRQRSRGTTGGTSGSTPMILKLSDSFSKS